MSERARSYADRLEQANRELIATVERLSDADWRARTDSEGWPVGVVAHHVAESHQGLAGLVRRIADGQPLPGFTRDMIDEGNAEHARKHADTTRAETLELLRKNAAAAVRTVRAFSDAELDRSATVMGNAMTAAQAIEGILIGHVVQHHGSIRKAVER